jgi:hypothetical protein
MPLWDEVLGLKERSSSFSEAGARPGAGSGQRVS